MIVDLFGIKMEVDGVTCHLWSPWRCSYIEHKLFEAVKGVPGVEFETQPDELMLTFSTVEQWTAANTSLQRVLKGWQEEASDAGTDRRMWRWLLEGDVDANGFDLNGERSCLWAYLRLALDRGGPGDNDKGEDIDFNGIGLSFWNAEEE